MSTSTLVRIQLEGFRLDGLAFSRLDECFAIERLKPHPEIEIYPAPPLNWETIGYDGLASRIVCSPDQRESAAARGTSMYLTYIASDDPSIVFDVRLNYSGTLMCTEIGVDTITEARPAYTAETKDVPIRLQNVCLCLHKCFNAIETRAVVDIWDEDHEPWFHFSDSQWKVAEFPLETET